MAIDQNRLLVYRLYQSVLHASPRTRSEPSEALLSAHLHVSINSASHNRQVIISNRTALLIYCETHYHQQAYPLQGSSNEHCSACQYSSEKPQPAKISLVITNQKGQEPIRYTLALLNIRQCVNHISNNRQQAYFL
jgi:hypothetical protein